jgi:asparagine synthase (glutamine-hydrolysing)
MCGILAILCQNEQKQLDVIMKSYDMLTNRGPDCGSLIMNRNEIIGFRRLTINDMSTKGNQPFRDGKIKVICNGEIYNHLELEKEYNLQCESKSDCECILHLYKLFGFKRTIELLNGDFSIVLIDGDRLYFARDCIGVRPLFYGFTNNNNFAVASYARALTGFCRNVVNFHPGIGEYSNNQIQVETYNDSLFRNISPCFLNGDGIRKAINETLTTAVKSRLMSDRPVACLLSGGLDSSLVVSILCKLIGPENVRTYSIGMEGSIDLHYAKEVSNFLGTSHTEVKFTSEEGISCIPEVIRDIESYDITTIRASVGMWMLARYIKKNTDDVVILSGEGADELFCGYLYFHYAPTSEELENESFRLVDRLYEYDVLRADRCVSSHGLELRVPFLDKNMVKLCLSIPGELKAPQFKMEKHILRTSFIDSYLPDNVLWRRKDGMSDGISGLEKKWYEHIQEYVDTVITDEEYSEHRDHFPSKEAYYYKKVYDDNFPSYQPEYEYWLPKWVNHGGDPSGRILNVFNE